MRNWDYAGRSDLIDEITTLEKEIQDLEDCLADANEAIRELSKEAAYKSAILEEIAVNAQEASAYNNCD